jgi:hypothetical protein
VCVEEESEDEGEDGWMDKDESRCFSLLLAADSQFQCSALSCCQLDLRLTIPGPRPGATG